MQKTPPLDVTQRFKSSFAMFHLVGQRLNWHVKCINAKKTGWDWHLVAGSGTLITCPDCKLHFSSDKTVNVNLMVLFSSMTGLKVEIFHFCFMLRHKVFVDVLVLNIFFFLCITSPKNVASLNRFYLQQLLSPRQKRKKQNNNLLFFFATATTHLQFKCHDTAKPFQKIKKANKEQQQQIIMIHP